MTHKYVTRYVIVPLSRVGASLAILEYRSIFWDNTQRFEIVRGLIQ